MAKWYGVIGYVITKQTSPGVWEEVVTERNYFGDVEKGSIRWSASSDSTNDDLNLNSQISIVADPFAYQHCGSIKYIEFMGAKWKITSIDPKPPRLVLTVGGVYNGS